MLNSVSCLLESEREIHDSVIFNYLIKRYRNRVGIGSSSVRIIPYSPFEAVSHSVKHKFF